MASLRVERKLSAILAADVAGYSRLVGIDEEGTLTQLKECRRLVIDPRLDDHRGRIVKTTGDGMLVQFASVVDALRCAVEIQRAMAEHNASTPVDRRIEFRMGVNIGDIIIDGDDIHGDGVNVAARLEGLSEPGGICVSLGVRDQVHDKLDLTFEDAGDQQLKNIVRPVRVYRVRLGAIVTKAALALALPDKPSIAVLPFTNMSGDPEQEYFSDGITEDIITELSRFHSLFVIARNSSFIYKGRAVNAIDVGRALGVRYVAEGSVRRAGDRVRVTAQLVAALTGAHLWAERFDRRLEDIFAVQDEVTRRIVTSIAPLLAGESLHLAKRKPPEDMRAYDYYLKAKVLVDNPRADADLKQAREYCDRAIQIDPLYARAYAYKAISYTVGVLTIEAEDLAEWRCRALLCAEEAVALDAMDSVSHWALGEATFFLGQCDRSRSHFARAISLNPNDADMLVVSSFIQAACGDAELGLRHIEMALERNPSNPPWYNWSRAGVLYLAGRYEDALAALELFGRANVGVLRWRAVILVKLGRIDEARIAMQALLVLKPSLTVSEAKKIFNYMPNVEDYVDCLRRAGLPE